MIISFIGNLLHNTKRKMGRARSLYGAEVFQVEDRKSTRLNSSHSQISYAVFCLKKKKNETQILSQLIDALRTRALPEIETLPLNREPHDLGGMTDDTVATFLGQAEAV